MSNQNIIKNQIENSLTKKGDENNENTNEKGQYENLAFNSKLILDVNEIPLRKDSETPQIKFSIDLPNAPKQRLHEYLNNDLINALENKIVNIKKIIRKCQITVTQNIGKKDTKTQKQHLIG